MKPLSTREVTLDIQGQLQLIRATQLEQQQGPSQMAGRREAASTGNTPPLQNLQRGLDLLEAGVEKLTPNSKLQALSTIEGKLAILVGHSFR